MKSSEKKVLIYAGIYPNNGTGNFIRMFHLYKYLIRSNNIDQLDFLTNDTDKANILLENLNEKKINFHKTNDRYNVLLIDSPYAESEILSKVKYFKSIALDFFNYDEKIDILINLYNHNKEHVHKFRGKIYEGLDFSILSNNFLTLKKEKFKQDDRKIHILITFGGEDPTSLTLQSLLQLNKIEDCKLTVILGALNKDKKKILSLSSEKCRVIESTNIMHTLMNTHDIIMCGGGTTLLEALYVGNPIIAIGQNSGERDFINAIKSSVPLFNMSDIEQLLIKSREKLFRDNICSNYQILVDGLGKSRIENIIVSEGQE